MLFRENAFGHIHACLVALHTLHWCYNYLRVAKNVRKYTLSKTFPLLMAQVKRITAAVFLDL